MTPVYLLIPIITVFYFAMFSAPRAPTGETDAAGILQPQFEGHPLSVILRFVLKLSLALVFFVGLAQLFSGNALLAPVAFASLVFTYIALRPLFGQQIASIITPLITLAWLLTRNWLALDLAAMLICAGTLVAFRNITLRMVIMVFASIMLFDVINVYGTGLVTQLALPAGAGGAITAAPLLIQVPKVFGLANSPMAAALGNGDIVVPGLLLMYLAKRGKSMALGLATLFYYFGLVLSTYVATHYGPQPATLFLCPATALGALIGLALSAGSAKRAFLAPFRRLAWWLVMGPLDFVPLPNDFVPWLFGFAIGSKGQRVGLSACTTQGPDAFDRAGVKPEHDRAAQDE